MKIRTSALTLATTAFLLAVATTSTAYAVTARSGPAKTVHINELARTLQLDGTVTFTSCTAFADALTVTNSSPAEQRGYVEIDPRSSVAPETQTFVLQPNSSTTFSSSFATTDGSEIDSMTIFLNVTGRTDGKIKLVKNPLCK